MTLLSEFTFDLPEELIALRPVSPRDHARLLHVSTQGALADRRIKDLPALLETNDVLVVNNTKVIPAQLFGMRKRGDLEAKIALTLHQRISPSCWRAFAKPGRKLAENDVIIIGADSNLCERSHLIGRIIKKDDLGVEIEFEMSGPDLDIAIAEHGLMPLPPYIAGKRPADTQDNDDYQTNFATHDGAVAAPTAGLHFTDELITAIKDKGASFCEVTLHVGAGTFLPVKHDDISQHKMHAEWGEITQETADNINHARAKGGRIIAVGTTSLRLLETAADAAGQLHSFAEETDIFITPGYKFKITDALLTNFHLPASTLFMLVSAFSGKDEMMSAYTHAIAQEYRFYSYGDACFLERGA